MAPEPLIRATNLEHTYPDGTVSLHGVDLEVYSQEFVAFIGQNGSGKTTLAKCLSGLFRPSAGSVVVEGIDTRSKGTVKKIVTRVGFVFQNPDHQLFNRTVRDEIAYGPRNLGLSEPEVAQRVEEAARVTGVRPELLENHPFFLPKGLRQRVAIASILALRPRTIIVDEPTTGQDRQQSIEIMNFLQRLRREEGHTIIIITHEMPIVAAYAERSVVLANGRILADGPTRDVLGQPQLLAQAAVFPPQITRLAQAVPALSPERTPLSVDELYVQIDASAAPAAATQ
jgi:energy-coupling factor transport system ATP-binding protein